MEQNSNITGANGSNANPKNENKPMTVQVECFINSKVLYWTTGLAAGSAIGLTAFVVWKLIRDRKR